MVMAHPEPLHPEDCKCPVCGQILHWPGSRKREPPDELPSDPGPQTCSFDYHGAMTSMVVGSGNTIMFPFNGTHLAQCRALRHVRFNMHERAFVCICGFECTTEHELMLHFRDHEHDWPKILTLAEMEDM